MEVQRQYSGSGSVDMAITSPEQPRDRRFQLRATASQETLIKVAAELQGVNVTDFIIRSACEAEHALSDQTRFALDDKQWKLFMDALDSPAHEKPRLRRPISKPIPQEHK